MTYNLLPWSCIHKVLRAQNLMILFWYATCLWQVGSFFQKQPFRSVLRKKCSENMEQIYRRTPLPKCDFNNVAKKLYLNHTSACAFSCKSIACFQNTFFTEHLTTIASVAVKRNLFFLFFTFWRSKYILLTVLQNYKLSKVIF